MRQLAVAVATPVVDIGHGEQAGSSTRSSHSREEALCQEHCHPEAGIRPPDPQRRQQSRAGQSRAINFTSIMLILYSAAEGR